MSQENNILTLQQKLFLSFGLLMAAILGIGGISVLNLNRMMETEARVDHTTGVIDHIQDLDSDLKKSQSAFRAFLITQNEAFLKSAQASFNLLLPNALEIQSMTQDDSSQKDSLDQLVSVLRERVERSRVNFALAYSGQLEKILQRFKEPRNLQENDRIDQLIARVISGEQNRLVHDREEEDAAARGNHLLLLGAGTLASVFAFGILLALNGEIRKREKIQEMVQLNEYRLFQYLEAVPLGIFVADQEGRPYYANEKAKELLGKGLVQGATGGQLTETYQAYLQGTDKIYSQEKSPLMRALQGEKCLVEDMEIHRPDGTVMPLQVWGAPVLDRNGKVQYAMTVFSDITDRLEIEKMKLSLISVVSHQLKTPVGEINGYVENLLDGIAGEMTEKQKEYLLDMRQIGMDNFRLISDLLNLSRIERGLLDAFVERISLEDVVRQSLRDYEKVIDRKKLNLTLEGLGGNLEVAADRDKLIETLRNLISNALKFTDRGGITLKAEVKERVVLLHVIDTGTGISDTALAQLFTQKRVLGTEAARAGAGLGLYVAKHFMRAQGGDITAVTQPGKGSRFTLTIPKAEG
jgi:PAS domain S-box-containing protein